jgi:hypothetical protein
MSLWGKEDKTTARPKSVKLKADVELNLDVSDVTEDDAGLE